MPIDSVYVFIILCLSGRSGKKKGEPGVTAFLFFLLALADLDRREWPEKRRKGCSGISQFLDFWQRMWSEETQ